MEPGFTYVYFNKRKNFGRQPMFSEVPVTLIDSIHPDKSEQNLYCLRNPVNHETQTSNNCSNHYVNTKITTYCDQGVEHVEGGWPKDVSLNDEEATFRYRRRTEREEMYCNAIMNTYSQFEHYIQQNNAINMYNMYFKEIDSQHPVEKYSIRTGKVSTDKDKRPVASICWTCEDDSKLVAAYCNKKYPITGDVNKNFECFVWDIEYPKEPYEYFKPPSACWQIVCSPSFPKVIFGGLQDGRVSIFDIREQNEPVVLSPMHLAHRDPVSTLQFMHSRLNTEFFSGSSDGKCMWWDIRNMSQPTDELIMSVRYPSIDKASLADSEGVSALQFDRSFPTKFLCGTDTGLVINVNRKGKSHAEIMSAVLNAHIGPVRAVHRSPCSAKIFITCGDWTTNVWSDDVRTAPIICGKAQRNQISDVIWAPHRVSGYMSVSIDGRFRYWDLLRKHHEPVLAVKISKYPLSKVIMNENNHLIAVGDMNGTLKLIRLSENLVWSEEKDKSLMMQCFERETRREHILETRVKEIRLKQKAEEEAEFELVDEDIIIRNAEIDYLRTITEEKQKCDTFTDRSGDRSHKMPAR
ncbi:dynein intermediate chain 3, ciliary-like [Bicyclus anynana]|uniref:Dynein intermediate chain 3, ciliary-like n=1 Tax=Bicyclus anynana TaxID=110368 RepID=A0A6J1P090_BICAN|nr:dynein intermediate chain 3, ciliary-like [Bicyclus anynana]